MSTKPIDAHLRVLGRISTSTCALTIRTHERVPQPACRKPSQPGRGSGRPRKAKG